MIMIALLLLLFAIAITLMYAAVVVASETDRKEREYWQNKARQEGREHGKETETP